MQLPITAMLECFCKDHIHCRLSIHFCHSRPLNVLLVQKYHQHNINVNVSENTRWFYANASRCDDGKKPTRRRLRLPPSAYVEPVCVFCCRRLPWKRKDVYSAAREYVGAMRVSHPWLQSTLRDPPDDIDMESSDRNTSPSQGEDRSTADELQTQQKHRKLKNFARKL